MDKNSHKTVMLPNNEVTQATTSKTCALILVDDSKNISAT